eukprot:TRINITY_DN6782_c0_g1_i1.p1 TRINITY_DN6782_c0_g1~~TRINITY_DN6782_c0_g1_i1.p1  ORF type:complete len:1015 (+),score=334.12 TRINITY_DN6782_c0_g1_i1:326-3046(+)
MRGNTAASKLIKAFLVLVGRPYLKEILGQIIHKIITESKTSLEIDPSKTETEDVDKNVTLLIERTKQVVDAMVDPKNVAKMPNELRIVASFFAEFGKEYAPNQVWALVGGFIVLRFINPALLTPENYGLLPEGKPPSGIARRNLTLIAKIVQNLASGVEFGKKEQYMMPVNQFIAAHKSIVEEYLQSVIVPNGPPPLPSGNIAVADLHYMHRIFEQHGEKIVNLLVNVKSEDATSFQKCVAGLGSYSSKISFSFLSQTDRAAVISVLEKYAEEATFVGWVDKKKYNKTQKRLLVICHNRVLSIKGGGKVVRDGHFLDLVEMKSSKPKELELIFKNFSILCESDEVDKIIDLIRSSFLRNFPGMPKNLQFKLNIDTSRLRNISYQEGPCGGFVNTYQSLCNFYSTPVNADVAWHFMHLPSSIKTFDLKRFTKIYSENPLATDDMGPIFWALRFNSYFDSLNLKKYKIDKESFLDVAEMFRFNRNITDLNISFVGAPKEGVTTLFDALSFNKNAVLTSLDISNNSLDDKTFTSMANFVTSSSENLKCVIANNVGMGKSGVAAISKAFQERSKIKGSGSLLKLSLSDNKLGAGIENLAGMLTVGGSHVTHLNLSNISSTLDPMLNNLSKSCQLLTHLDISRNKLKKEDCLSLWKFLKSTKTLIELNLAGTKLSTEFLPDLFSSVSRDIDLVLNLSDNGFGVQGAKIISGLSLSMSNIHTLNLSDNDLNDEGIAELAEGLCSNTTIKSLVLDRNMKGGKSKMNAIESLSQLVTSNSHLEAISLKGDKGAQFKVDIAGFLSAIGSNVGLTHLDVSGQGMGNRGVIAMAKALRKNRTLRSISWDENQTGLLGFINIRNALETNETIQVMPLPFIDFASASKTDNPSDLQAAFTKIEEYIVRNQQGNVLYQYE